MDRTLQYLIRQEFCPDGIWQLSNVMKSVLKYHIFRLPKDEVLESETRYPKSPAAMRAFLVRFFTRHYFQTQNSLLDYMTSNEFLNLLVSGKLQTLDVGCGPAIASLAITDMLACVLEHLENAGEWPRGAAVKLTYVLNDTSGICLGTGQRMLTDYYNIARRHNGRVVHGRVFSMQKAFPDNMSQLRRIKLNLGTYDMAIFSYVVSPLNEDKGFDGLVNGLLNIEELCSHNERILILQDRFKAARVRQMSRAIDISSHKEELIQHVYPSRNASETYTYSYYCCLYAPDREKIIGKSCVA